MKKRQFLDPLSKAAGNILPRKQYPPKSVTPKVGELAPGSMLAGQKLDRSIVICISCLKPIYIVYHDLNKDPIPIECDYVPKMGDEPCPRCGAQFARYDAKLKKAQYLTNLGWV